jgi:hypothetical protein
MNKTGRGGYAAPSQHGGRHDLARTPFFNQQCARNTQHYVADEENAGAKAEHGVGEVQLRGHFEAREADVVAVDVGNDVEQEEKGHQPPRDAPAGAFSEIESNLDRVGDRISISRAVVIKYRNSNEEAHVLVPLGAMCCVGRRRGRNVVPDALLAVPWGQRRRRAWSELGCTTPATGSR